MIQSLLAMAEVEPIGITFFGLASLATFIGGMIHRVYCEYKKISGRSCD